MKKSLLISLVLIFIFISLGSGLGIYTFVKGDYQAKINSQEMKKKEVNDEIAKLKIEQDVNGYLPSDVIKFFMSEVSSSAFDRAKLYLSQDRQALDIEKTLSLGFPLSSIKQTEVSYEVDGETALVKYYYQGQNADEEEARIYLKFGLNKEDGVWKITSMGK